MVGIGEDAVLEIPLWAPESLGNRPFIPDNFYFPEQYKT